MVGTILLIVLALIVVWLVSPAFRTWSEQPKYGMLERNALFEHITPENSSPVDIESRTGSALPVYEMTPNTALIKTGRQ